MPSVTRSALLVLLIVVALPATADGIEPARDPLHAHSHAGRQGVQVDVPGWRLPAARVLPPVGYTARPLPGDAPAHGGHPRHAPRWITGIRHDDPRHGPTWIVRDPGRFGLRMPPPGYYWRGDGRGSYLLVAAGTGVVAGVVRRRG
ncbi:RcnB family protein [Luteimonas vadosa]|uniref:RcnB family protein n=1 Tax=Luteimonas vadosa TaxID=1165507 RepID=A0ABP9DQZ7_9GAMM